VLAPHFAEVLSPAVTPKDSLLVASGTSEERVPGSAQGSGRGPAPSVPTVAPEATDEVPLVIPTLRQHARFLSQVSHVPKQEAPVVASPIAIIGISGAFPQARDVQSLWSNLLAGRDCIGEIPASRWDWQTYFGSPETSGNSTSVKWAGVIEDVEM